MKARCCGGDFNDDGTRTLYLEVPPGTHIQIDDEWVIERTADQPDDAHPLVRRLHEVAAAVAKSNSGQHVSPAVFAEILESVQQADAIIKADQQSAECRHGAAHFVETGRWRCNYCPQEAASPQELRASDQQPAAHYPVEWGPSDARQLTCACGNPDPAHADQQSARQGLDELTRMAQEDGLYDGPADKT
jgi:hypothetical protein